MSLPEQGNTDTNTHVFFCCAALEYLGVWLQVQNSNCRLQNRELLASVKRKRQLPREKTLLSFLPHRKENRPVCTGLPTRVENENRLEKEQNACNSLFGVLANKIHLSSPDESRCFQMAWRKNRSLHGN